MKNWGVDMKLITEIREKRGIMEISADGCVVLRVRKTHFALLPLEEGDELDPEEYENQIAAVQFRDAYEAALTSLDFAARTAREIERSLLQKGYVPQAAAAVIERLMENRLIDDKQIAGRIAQTSSGKPVGIYAVKRKLRAKGISEEDAEAALEVFNDAQQLSAARQAAEKLSRKYRELPVREARAKLSQALARRGFPWDAVREAVDQIFSGEDYFD